jgi:hypothetical protein
MKVKEEMPKYKEEQEVREQKSEICFLFFDFWSCVNLVKSRGFLSPLLK